MRIDVQHQVDRILRHASGEEPPPVRLRLAFVANGGGDEVLGKAREVMQLVASGQSDAWPGDDEWRRRLPGWFLVSFEGHTLAELAERPELWDFGSWLDAMKNPGWEWWSCRADDKGGTVRTTAHADPYSIEPLIYLLRVAGASEVRFEEE